MHHDRKHLVPLLTGAILLAACSESQHPVAPAEPSVAAAAAANPAGGPPWSIAFVSTRSGNPDIFVMNPSGTDQAGLDSPRNLTADNAGADQWPAWSSDGRIAFSSARDGHANLELYVMSSDGGDVTRLTTTTTANIQPAWSPSATEIAFVRGAGPTDNPFVQGSRQIWVHDMSTGAERQLTHAGDNYHPAWSPDGKQIIFSSDRNADFSTPAPEKSANLGLHDIYIMSADAGDAVLTRVTYNPTSLDGEPSFSPDGKLIAFRTRRETAVDPDGVVRHWCTIAVANVDGSDIRYLTPKPADLPSTQWCNAFPSWSHNGKEIYFHSARFGIPLDIYAVGVDGTGLRRLTYNPAAETAPAAR